MNVAEIPTVTEIRLNNLRKRIHTILYAKIWMKHFNIHKTFQFDNCSAYCEASSTLVTFGKTAQSANELLTHPLSRYIDLMQLPRIQRLSASDLNNLRLRQQGLGSRGFLVNDMLGSFLGR